MLPCSQQLTLTPLSQVIEPVADMQQNETGDTTRFDAITTRGGSGLSDSAHVDPGQYWHGERVWKSSFLHEDFDLMTSSTGLTTERSSIHGSPLRSRKNQETR
ncbi:hypothetical protein M378DRAFT_350508 [Amanita muscaria Koide BX008]|uniref:Uncharacterized protein n=1 Tax=Amanita muscaria (strain Koide BX008) TaxID=946122 RepID=A0A0C2TIK2_AMAMK|nr:hypothetical protein M378DRAFT_350508 [Amanita muscaria Koide BX008]